MVTTRRAAPAAEAPAPPVNLYTALYTNNQAYLADRIAKFGVIKIMLDTTDTHRMTSLMIACKARHLDLA